MLDALMSSQPVASVSQPLKEIDYQKLKQSLHRRLVESLDVMAAKDAGEDALRNQLPRFIDEVVSLATRKSNLSQEQQNRLRDELPDEMFGLGPLELLMSDDSVADILVNNPHEVFIERGGVLEKSNIVFADEEHLLRIIRRIASSIGRRIDEVSPMVDARLEDGSRVNAVIAPLALDGPKLSIRRFAHGHLSLKKLTDGQTLDQKMADYLSQQVRNRRSIMISGGTGAGKTTLLNALSACVPPKERIVTIEDAAELVLQHPHVARLETRPANSEGTGAISQRDLVRNALRMRPDRIFVGEVRGEEALDMLQAMNTGHEGSLTTIHANGTRDAISRLEMMVAMTGLELPVKVVRAYITAGIHIIVHVNRFDCGTRRVTRISELKKSFDNEVNMRDIFTFHSGRFVQNECTEEL